MDFFLPCYIQGSTKGINNSVRMYFYLYQCCVKNEKTQQLGKSIWLNIRNGYIIFLLRLDCVTALLAFL